jgi:excisionase family DNA binding protein
MNDTNNNKPTSQTLTPITVEEVADMLGMHRTSVYDGARAGEIPCRRVGRRFIFVREVIEKWLLCEDYDA